MKLLLVLATFFFTPVVTVNNSCDSAINSDRLNNCLFEKKALVTKKLDNEFKRYLNEIKINYSGHMDIGNDLLMQAKDSQRKWHEYMVSTCKVYSFQVENGTRTHTTIMNRCISDKMEERINEISSMINSM